VFLFLDEMSMIGLRLLDAIDSRPRQIFPLCHDKPFGGLTVVLFGDFYQLPSVMDSPMYAPITDQSVSILQHASRLYRTNFTRAFEV
jgi:ATP-dependent DNA helicase PIF1